MRRAFDPSCAFEAVDEHSDSSRGQRQPIAKIALGKRAVGFEVLECVQVGCADACATCG